MVTGHITICKIYKDGTKETVVDRANLVTAGLGSSFIDIQTDSGSTFIEDYAPRYFQLGTSTIDYDKTAITTSACFYRLSAPFDWSDYGDDTDLTITQEYRGFNASTTDTSPPYSYTEMLLTSGSLSSSVFSGTDQYFAAITPNSVTKWFMDSFESQFILDENSANGKAITEIGLFAKNPKGFREDSPLLMAYRKFAAINKTAEFSLAVNWSIGFLGLTNKVDDVSKRAYTTDSTIIR